MGATASSKAPPVAADFAKSPAETTRVRTKHARLPGNQALLRLQRKCSCSGAGTCGTCQSKDPFRIQTKVMVGPARDPFEREADAVAESVMRMPAEDFLASPAVDLRVQRACAACEQETEDDGPIRRQAIGAEGGNAEGLSHDILTRGGTALAADVRGFFESRFSRDFSPVRIHTGVESQAINAAMRSHAFTYGNHIWLGAGLTAAPSPLIAHELAHVVQQSGSPALHRGSDLSADREGRIRRADFWYFEPFNTNGTTTHAAVLTNLQRSNPGLMDEVACPRANDPQDFDKTPGRADLYKAKPKSMIGVFFKGHDKPENLTFRLHLEGVKRAPVYNHATKTLKNVEKAPSEVQIGDLKPIGEPSHKGVKQIQEYVYGLNLVGSEIKDGLQDVKTDGTWNSGVSYAKTLTGLTIPKIYNVKKFAGQDRQELVLKAASLAGRASDRVAVRKEPLGDVQGRLVVQEDPQFPGSGIFNHFWVPDSLPLSALPAELQGLDGQMRERIIPSLTRVPVGVQPKLRQDAVTSDGARTIRRRWGAPKGIVVKDPFNYAVWQKEVDVVRTSFHKSEENKKSGHEIAKVEGTASAVKNLKNQGAGDHLEIPKDAAGLKKLRFWTGPAAKVLGRFRQLFGGAFVNIARLFLWGREKFRQFLKNHQKDPPNAPGGAMGTVARIIFKVAKYALMTMMPQIADRLWDSLTTGVKAKLKSLIPESIAEVYEEKKEQFEGVLAKLEEIANKDVLQWLKKLVEPIETVLSDIGKAISFLKDVKQIVTAIKRAIQLINCATAIEGNVAGCVASLIGPVLDWMINKIVQTCTVQKEIISRLVDIDIIRKKAPNLIAGKLIGFGRSLLPTGWEDILAEPSQDQYFAHAGDIPCEEKRTEMEMAMDELSLALGDDEARIFALAELMNALGGGGDMKHVDVKAILEVANLINVFDITAEQMQAWARNIETPPKDIPEGFRQPMSALFQSIAAGDPAPKEFDQPGMESGDGGAGSGTGAGSGGGGKGQGTGVGDDRGAGAGAGTGDAAKSGKTIRSVPSSEVQWTGVPSSSAPDATVDVIAGASAKHKRGQEVSLTLHGVREISKIDTVVTDVKAKVITVTEKGGKVVSVTYELLDGVTFDVERVTAAKSKGQALGCFRICLGKGKTRTVPFEPVPAKAK